MNQGRIWCVVSPTVGLPLLLGSVTTIALLVHASVMNHTTWMSGYWQGGANAKVAQAADPSHAATPTSNAPALAVSVTPVNAASGDGATSFVVTVTPRTAPATAPAMVADTGARPAQR
jgi:light-harvesting protein B-800-850 alpha chain